MTSIATARLWLRTLYAQVPTTYATLLLVLTAEATAKLAAISGGLIAGTSADGHSVQFSSPGDSLSADDWAQTASLLLDLYDACLAILISSGVPSPTDAQIYAEMMSRLSTNGQVRLDFTTIRQ